MIRTVSVLLRLVRGEHIVRHADLNQANGDVDNDTADDKLSEVSAARARAHDRDLDYAYNLARCVVMPGAGGMY